MPVSVYLTLRGRHDFHYEIDLVRDNKLINENFNMNMTKIRNSHTSTPTAHDTPLDCTFKPSSILLNVIARSLARCFPADRTSDI